MWESGKRQYLYREALDEETALKNIPGKHPIYKAYAHHCKQIKEIEQSVELTEDCATKLNLNDLASQKKFEYSSSSS